MGQGPSSQPQQQQPAPPPPNISDEERAQAQAEMRAIRQAALDKRFANQQKKPTPTSTVRAQATKKPSALEEMSKENVGWRNVDAQTEFRRWD